MSLSNATIKLLEKVSATLAEIKSLASKDKVFLDILIDDEKSNHRKGQQQSEKHHQHHA